MLAGEVRGRGFWDMSPPKLVDDRSSGAILVGVGFFDDFAPPPPPPDPPPYEPKAWMGPPAGWVGGWVPWHAVLTRTDDFYSVVTDVEAFPSGLQFSVVSRFRPGSIDLNARRGPMMMGFGAPDGPRFGVGFSDGRKAMVGDHRFPGHDAEPEGPVLTPRGGGGGMEDWRMGMWLWPLPPPGAVTFVTSWEEFAVAEAAVSLDADELVAAAGRAVRLWSVDPNDGHGRGGSASGAYITSIGEMRSPPPTDA